ncbi:MAG: hypothetical protein GEU28_00620 [Dehalococcoidia bacterium]|nr:hypothetical protein [Dehalococcoidia bacterium]
MSSLPLDGLTVLEMGEGVSAAFCSKLLAAHGAEVMKVDPIARGSATDEGLYEYLHSGKRSIAIDIETDDGREVIRRLVLRAEALVENFEAGYLASIGLPFEDLRRRKPRLLMTSITPFGQGIVHSGDAEAESRGAGTPGDRVGHPDAEYIAGIQAFAATSVGLYACNYQEVGQWIDISVQACLVASLAVDWGGSRLIEIPFPVTAEGRRPTAEPGSSIRFSDVEPDQAGAPVPGEHTEEILADIGLRGDEIAGLRDRGVI